MNGFILTLVAQLPPQLVSPPPAGGSIPWPHTPPPGSSAAAACTDTVGYAHMSSTRSRLFGSGQDAREMRSWVSGDGKIVP